MVQHDDALKISKKWNAAGQPYCTHDNYEKEYYLSQRTEDYVCLDCGISWSSKHHDKPEPIGNKE